MEDVDDDVHASSPPSRPRWAWGLAVAGAALAGLFLGVGLAGATDATVTVSGCSGWQFSPQSVTVDAGDTVTFSNPTAESGCSGAPHTSFHTDADPDKAWNTGNIALGASVPVTMTEAGTFGYRCAYHGSMTGTVVVRATSADLPPTVTIVSPADGATVEPGIVRIAGTASSDATSVSLLVDGGTPRAVVGTTSWSYDWDTSGVEAGSAHTLVAVASDGRNLGESDAVHLTLARPDAGPKVAIFSPRPSVTVKGLIAINGTASDDNGVERVEIRIDGGNSDGAWRLAGGTTEWRFSWDTREMRDDTYVIEARATDTAGGFGFSPSVAVVVANAPAPVEDDEDPAPPPPNRIPVLGPHRPAKGETVSGAVNFRVTASDPDGDALTLQLRVDGQAFLTSPPPLVYTWPAYLAAPGPHVAVALACDAHDCATLEWGFTVAGSTPPEKAPPPPSTDTSVEPDPTRFVPKAEKESPAPFAALALLAALLARRRRA